MKKKGNNIEKEDSSFTLTQSEFNNAIDFIQKRLAKSDYILDLSGYESKAVRALRKLGASKVFKEEPIEESVACSNKDILKRMHRIFAHGNSDYDSPTDPEEVHFNQLVWPELEEPPSPRRCDLSILESLTEKFLRESLQERKDQPNILNYQVGQVYEYINRNIGAIDKIIDNKQISENITLPPLLTSQNMKYIVNDEQIDKTGLMKDTNSTEKYVDIVNCTDLKIDDHMEINEGKIVDQFKNLAEKL